MKRFLLSLFIVISTFSAWSQTPEEVRKIVSSYDVEQIKEKEAFYRKKQENDKRKAEAVARINNWPIVIENPDGSRSELMKLTPDGYPMYYQTENIAAARTTRTNFLHTGGAMGLNLNGQGMTVRVWDGGTARATHNAFGGRLTVVDDPNGTLSSHATHVTGTMISGLASIKGMAPQALARTFNWTDDESEALSEVQEGMLISNHSYGVPISSTLPAWIIGAYISDSYAWDEIAYLSPYYLAVVSAGNNGTTENSDPLSGGYDKLTTNKTCKNNLVVANCQDVLINADGTVSGNININPDSSQGPTDDFRIKPDITGNGTNLTSANSTGNSATTTFSGTSMSAPNVSGSLILLQQHHNNLYNSYMRSATLKGIACHTADDAGDIGPDPIFGWGLLNMKKAAETITNNGLSSWVSEQTLRNEEVFTMTVNSNGTTPLMASITWTDLPGNMNMTATSNEFIRALVNDLDIRITRNGTTYFPWRLSQLSLTAERNGDNNVDNVELVKIDAPAAGTYTITVTHKGILVDNAQKYSLVITGINSTFALNSTSSDLELCANQNATYTFNHTQSGSGTTTFSAAGLPSGANASFSPASLSANGTVTMTITGLSNVIPGEYSVGITGTRGAETETRTKILKLYSASFQNVALNSPANQSNGTSTSVNLRWTANSNAETYLAEVSTTPNFSVTTGSLLTSSNQFFVFGLAQETTYYWRVTPYNRCGAGISSSATVYSFTTGALVCDQLFEATDYSDASIASVANSSASVPLTITGGYTIGDMNINLNITHTYVQDMTITLEGPSSIGSPVIRLLQEPCGDNDNIDCKFDDIGSEPACTGSPSISGLIAPLDSLSDLNSLSADGVWTLRVNDPWNGDGGTINLFSIELCRLSPSLSINENNLQNVTLYPNPANDNFTVFIPNNNSETTISLFDIQGRQIQTVQSNAISTSISTSSLQDGLYLVTIENENGITTKKITIKK
jgi:subtilisin-like proprotein convertase family protein